ncbi:MAG: hypothetical protein ABI573_05980 [Chloroflexota bacterium]
MKSTRPENTKDQQADRPEPSTEVSTSGRFLRGLTLGALVGAAIAGSAVWDRLRNREHGAAAEPPDLEAGAD